MKKKIRSSGKKLAKTIKKVPIRAVIKNRTKIVHTFSILLVIILSIDFLQNLLENLIIGNSSLVAGKSGRSGTGNTKINTQEKDSYIKDLSIDVYNNSKYYYGTEVYIQKNMGWFWNYKVADKPTPTKIGKKYLRLINFSKNYFVEQEMRSEMAQINPNFTDKDIPPVLDLMTNLLEFGFESVINNFIFLL